MQSRTVGVRIASILREREAEDEALAAAATSAGNEDGQHQNKKRHKKKLYRVVIHSSPFLRCVQTSIAISAGLASTPFPSATIMTATTTTTATEGLSPVTIPSHVGQGASLSPNPTHSPGKLTISTNVHSRFPVLSHGLSKSVLRLDSFLGEWLSPGYFEHITPPPRSTLMLATAKAELLRRENYDEYPNFMPYSARHSPHTSGQLWSARTGSVPMHGSPLATPGTPSPRLPSGPDSLSSSHDKSQAHTGEAQDYLQHPGSGHRGYMSPVPSYAISTSQPIPRGYVAHARDACVDLDYQWDSTRDSLAWGDGGVLPEEWAAMHQRFRKGLRRLVDFYTTTPNPAEMVTKTPTSADPKLKVVPEESEDVEIENVVILVSHGAGCNALVGAITQQPVLADIPMSSITMAQRRPGLDEDDEISYDRGFSLDDALTRRRGPSDLFELKLFANTDHLLSSVPKDAAVGRSASLAGPHGSSGGLFSGNYTSALRDINFADAYGSSPGSRSNSANASLGSIRRAPQSPSAGSRLGNHARPNVSGGVTVGSGATSLLTHRPVRSGSMGLWQPKQEREPESEAVNTAVSPNPISHEKGPAEAQEQIAPAIRRSSNDSAEPGGPSPRQRAEDTDEKGQHESAVGEEEDRFDDAAPHLWAGTGNGGLWGAPRPPGEAERLRDFSSMKRRWTVNER